MARWSRGRIRTSPLDSPEADSVLGHLPPEERFGQAWLLDAGRLHGGHEAGWHAVYRLPGGVLLRPLRHLPGFQPLSRRLYSWIASRRSPACRLRH